MSHGALFRVCRLDRMVDCDSEQGSITATTCSGAKVARPAGLEPATPGLEGRCSIQLSYGRARSGSLSVASPSTEPEFSRALFARPTLRRTSASVAISLYTRSEVRICLCCKTTPGQPRLHPSAGPRLSYVPGSGGLLCAMQDTRGAPSRGNVDEWAFPIAPISRGWSCKSSVACKHGRRT